MIGMIGMSGMSGMNGMQCGDQKKSSVLWRLIPSFPWRIEVEFFYFRSGCGDVAASCSFRLWRTKFFHSWSIRWRSKIAAWWVWCGTSGESWWGPCEVWILLTVRWHNARNAHAKPSYFCRRCKRFLLHANCFAIGVGLCWKTVR